MVARQTFDCVSIMRGRFREYGLRTRPSDMWFHALSPVGAAEFGRLGQS
jgi:hypothetical protein